jgi:hypothetical protein
MIDPTRIDYGTVAKVARDGSPLLLQALGRLYGIGPSERSAFGANGGGVPTWAWAVVALGAGVVIGTRLQKHYPRYVPNLISGER